MKQNINNFYDYVRWLNDRGIPVFEDDDLRTARGMCGAMFETMPEFFSKCEVRISEAKYFQVTKSVIEQIVEIYRIENSSIDGESMPLFERAKNVVTPHIMTADYPNAIIDRLTKCAAKYCINCVLALDFIVAGEPDAAWAKMAEAQFYEGVFWGVFEGSSSVRELAIRGADRRHAENRAMKQEAVDHYLENLERYESKDAAAEDIAGKIVPVKFRTVRGWLNGLPPAGRA